MSLSALEITNDAKIADNIRKYIREIDRRIGRRTYNLIQFVEANPIVKVGNITDRPKSIS